MNQPLYEVKSGLSQETKLLCRQCADHTAGIAACQPPTMQVWFPCVISKAPTSQGECPMCDYRRAAYRMHDRVEVSA